MDPNANTAAPTVPVGTIKKVLNNYARHASTAQEKHFIFSLCEQLGGEIRSISSGFNEADWLQQCGVKPEWATVAA